MRPARSLIFAKQARLASFRAFASPISLRGDMMRARWTSRALSPWPLLAPSWNHNPPVWTIELTRRTLKRSGRSLDAVVAMLRAAGLSLRSYDPTSRELNPWRECDRKIGHVGDAVAIADDHLSQVRQRLWPIARP